MVSLRDCTNIRPCRIFDFGTMVDHGNMVVGLYARPCYGRIWSNIRIFLNSDRSRPRNRGQIPWSCNPCFFGKIDSESLPPSQEAMAIGKQLAEKSKGLFSAEDWQCSKCGNINWARQVFIKECSAQTILV